MTRWDTFPSQIPNKNSPSRESADSRPLLRPNDSVRPDHSVRPDSDSHSIGLKPVNTLPKNDCMPNGNREQNA